MPVTQKEYECKICGYKEHKEPESLGSCLYDLNDGTYMCVVCWDEIK